MEYFHEGSPDTILNETRAGELLDSLLDRAGTLRRVLLIPPDFTRFHSWAGTLTALLYERLKGRAHVEILPALGTHFPMISPELDAMFPGIPHDCFREHNWRSDLTHLGEAPPEFIEAISGGQLRYPIRFEINRLLTEGRWDRIFSIGQLVPHEVIGIANHNKNIYVGVGGQDTINKTHYLGAVCNMERVLGREKSPVRDVFNYADAHCGHNLPVTYLLTVRARDAATGRLVTRGLFAGEGDDACFLRGAKLCQQVNLDLLEAPLRKVVVSLDPSEFKSTWLGNKAIYRTRMAMADGGELIILAPGVREFGEDPEIDRLVRKYGYRGTPHTLRQVAENPELAANLSAAAHLIHGSSEGRFRVTYCPGGLTREEVESVGFAYGDLTGKLAAFKPEKLRDGFNTLPNGEEVFYISNPALGLWGLKEQFQEKI